MILAKISGLVSAVREPPSNTKPEPAIPNGNNIFELVFFILPLELAVEFSLVFVVSVAPNTGKLRELESKSTDEFFSVGSCLDFGVALDLILGLGVVFTVVSFEQLLFVSPLEGEAIHQSLPTLAQD